jgi:hypothetical protein
MNSSSGNQPFKPEWKEDRVFEDGLIAVVVLKSNHRTPAYRLVLNFKFNFGEVRRVAGYQPKFELADGVVRTDFTMGDTISKLWAAALAYTVDARQEIEDQWRARKAHQGQMSGAPGQRPGLKALAKNDKKQWQERQAAKAAEVAKAAETSETNDPKGAA